MTREELKNFVKDINHLTTCKSLSEEGYRNVLATIQAWLNIKEWENNAVYKR